MTAKQFLFDIEARNRMLIGIDILARAVGVTLGPRGRNVVVENGTATPHITKDGETVARAFDLEDRFHNLGAQVVKEVAAQTNRQAGDGTSTAIVLAQAMLHAGVKLVAGGANPVDVKRGIDLACAKVVTALRDAARPVSGQGDIARVATISANGEADIGAQIADAMERVGRNGAITVKENLGFITRTEVVSGFRFEGGFVSPHFVTDLETSTVNLEDAYILLHEGKLTSIKPLVPILEAVSKADRPLLIIAEDVDGEALSALVVNKLRGGLKVAAVKAPGFGERRKGMLQDIAVMTGSIVVTSDMGMTLESTDISMLGRLRRVEITRQATTLIDGGGEAAQIKARVDQLQKEMHAALSGHEKEALRERLAKLAGGVAIIHVGGMSEVELRERKDRVEDALNATRAAVEEGITTGGGVALVRASRTLADLAGANGDETAGIMLVRHALNAPLIQIADNAGFDGTFVIGKVQDAKEEAFGLDAATGEYGNLVDRGIVDPVKVIRIALENACSVAGAMITAQVAITDAPCGERVDAT